MPDISDRLLRSQEPSIRFKLRVGAMGEDPESPGIRGLQGLIRRSARLRALLAEASEDGPPPFHPYAKWYGAHWIMATLADIGYPPGDERLIPWRERVYRWLLPLGRPRKRATLEGRPRRHGSQEGNAVWYMLKLGMADDRTDQLAEALISWQWRDGGWNCDSKPSAQHSSFHETLIPLRALALHAEVRGSAESGAAARRAAEVFLKRRLFLRRSDGEVMHKEFVRLHYPPYWHYDILFGLKVLSEAGFIGDTRCHEALELLESKRLPDGGWVADRKYYYLYPEPKPRRELMDWGPVGRGKMNEWVTADALYVIRAAGRLG